MVLFSTVNFFFHSDTQWIMISSADIFGRLPPSPSLIRQWLYLCHLHLSLLRWYSALPLSARLPVKWKQHPDLPAGDTLGVWGASALVRRWVNTWGLRTWKCVQKGPVHTQTVTLAHQEKMNIQISNIWIYIYSLLSLPVSCLSLTVLLIKAKKE